MKVYHVWTDNFDYDEYDSFVVVAKCELDALKMVDASFKLHQLPDVHVDEVDLTEEKVILSSFNAG